ncbi:MAG: AGE family epimerase/isomerase [Longimicrobiales bacterium]
MRLELAAELRGLYEAALLNDVVPFWTSWGADRKYGGIMTALDRDGTVLDTDKGMWQQGRFAWLMATLHQNVEPRAEWLDLARQTIEFIRRYGFDHDGRMFFQVTREGRPLRKRRYAYAEAFTTLALAAYARAAGDEAAGTEARELFGRFLRYTTTPGLLESKYLAATRRVKGLAVPMITLNVAQVLRETIGDTRCDAVIDSCISEIERDFVKPEVEAVLETVGPRGELLDHFDGRTLNPGHAIEAAWFILHEARRRDRDPDLIRLGTTMLDWMWKRGWDTEYGGLFYFRDVSGLPVQEYWHDMKFWWPHCEATIATLLAYRLTGDQRYARWHRQVHDWSFEHFADPEHGEWFGYVHRDGRLSVRLKGNLWKGPFHLPRMLFYCSRLSIELPAIAGSASNPPITRPDAVS